MGEVVFTHAARYRMAGGAAPSVVTRPRRDGNAPRTAEQSAASRLGPTLDLFNVPPATRSNLIAEAAGLDEITNLNPAMVAASQVFFHQTRGRYTDELFRTNGRRIVEVLESEGAIGVRDDDRKEINMLNLLRYICIIGEMRGVPNLPPLA